MLRYKYYGMLRFKNTIQLLTKQINKTLNKIPWFFAIYVSANIQGGVPISL